MRRKSDVAILAVLSDPEIEVSPEMIEMGVRELTGACLVGLVGPLESPEGIVRTVFLAMEALRPRCDCRDHEIG